MSRNKKQTDDLHRFLTGDLNVSGSRAGQVRDVPLSSTGLNKIKVKQEQQKKQKSRQQQFTLLIVLFLLVGLISLSVYWFNRPGEMVGSVFDASDGSELTGVTILLDEQNGLENNHLTGSFFLKKIPKGVHTLTFKRQGFATKSEVFKIRAGDQKELKVYMKPVRLINGLQGENLLILNNGSNDLTVFNTLENRQIMKIKCGPKPMDIKVFQDLNKAYVANSGNNTLSVIDFNEMKLLKTIKLAADARPQKLFVSPEHDILYIFDKQKSRIFRLDPYTDKLIDNNVIQLGSAYRDLVFDPVSGNFMALSSSSVDFINNTGNNFKKISYNGISPQKISNSPLNDAVFLAGSGGILQVSPFTDAVVKYAPDKFVHAFITDHNESRLYYVTAGELSILDLPNHETILSGLVTGGERASSLKISPDGTKLYISHENSDDVYIFDLSGNEMLPGRIKAGNKPVKMAFIEIKQEKE